VRKRDEKEALKTQGMKRRRSGVARKTKMNVRALEQRATMRKRKRRGRVKTPG